MNTTVISQIVFSTNASV